MIVTAREPMTAEGSIFKVALAIVGDITLSFAVTPDPKFGRLVPATKCVALPLISTSSAVAPCSPKAGVTLAIIGAGGASFRVIFQVQVAD
jgi:hypothetical protein